MSDATILLVDDERLVLQGLTQVLRGEPYTVLTATSGAEALLTLQKKPIHVLVCDERMPGMSGSELVHRALEAYPDLVCIMLTGQADLATSAELIQTTRLYRFLSKPQRPDELKRTLAQAVQMQRTTLASARLRDSLSAGVKVARQ